MENITIEKSFRFDEVIDSIEMINIDDQLRCEILDDDTHAVKTINVTGLLNTTLGQKDFKEDVEVDIYAPFEKQIDKDSFNITLKDYSYSVNNKTLTVYMVLSISGLVDKQEESDNAIEANYDEIINSMNNINDINNINEERVEEEKEQDELKETIKIYNKETNSADHVSKTWATDLFKLTENYSVFKVIHIEK